VSLGFEVQQSLRGSYHRLSEPGEEHPLTLEVHAKIPLTELLRRREGQIQGTLHAPGYAEDAPIDGTISIKPVAGKLAYDFRFEADDGRERRFHGETEVHLRRIVRTLEDLVGRVYDDEQEEVRVLLTVPMHVGIANVLRTLRASFTTRA